MKKFNYISRLENKVLMVLILILSTILIITILSGCGDYRQVRKEKKCQKAIETAKKLGCLKFSDSVSKTDSTPITLKPEEVDNASDSIMGLLRQALIDCYDSQDQEPVHDTIIREKEAKIRNRIREIINQIPCEIKPIEESNDKYGIKIWVKDGKLLYSVKIPKKPEKICQECEKIEWYQKYWWLWIVFTSILFFLIVLLANKITYIK